jgi:hypothetical protein
MNFLFNLWMVLAGFVARLCTKILLILLNHVNPANRIYKIRHDLHDVQISG